MNQQALSHRQYPPRFLFTAAQFTFFFLSFVGTLAATRIVYELAFPRVLWLGRPLPALLIALFVTYIIWSVWFFRSQMTPQTAYLPTTMIPLVLNLIYLIEIDVDLVRSRFIFAASLWLVALFSSRKWLEARYGRFLSAMFVMAAVLPVYLLTMSNQVGRDDVFEFQVVTPQLGIVHPTGYPLYLLMGKLFTLLPFGSPAWRLNLASAMYTVCALCVLMLLLRRVWKRPLLAILTPVIIGLSLTLWSQAIIAEVYALHLLIVSLIVWLLVIGIVQKQPTLPFLQNPHHIQVAIAALMGLGLTNHLTTIIMIPVVVVTVWVSRRPSAISRQSSGVGRMSQFWGTILAAFILPLLLYAYLPIRWQAVVGEPMGSGRFFDWVIGGRFQGALQLLAWLRDPARYAILGRLFLDNWGWFNLLLALFGLAYLAYRQWRVALLLILLFAGYTFYGLNYYVPDLAVFIIPAQVVVGLGWGAGVWGIFESSKSHLQGRASLAFQTVALSILCIPILITAIETWKTVDQSADDGRLQWGTAVLDLPLVENGAILADSEKYPPLYYLQQTEGIRPDLDISVWPDEAAYRTQLERRLAAGQTVYLARFLPGLEGIYHLRSLGPLTEVSPAALENLPAHAVPVEVGFGDIRLVGYWLETEAAVDATQTAVTLYWQADIPITTVQHVYVRWTGYAAVEGQHPANNNYPTVAWKPGELVADYHQWARPILQDSEVSELQVALAPPFTSPDKLTWQTVVAVPLSPSVPVNQERPYRAQIGGATLTGATFDAQSRPERPLAITVTGFGTLHDLSLRLHPAEGDETPITILPVNISPTSVQEQVPFLATMHVETTVENGRYHLVASHPSGATCGWIRASTDGCILGDVHISGVPIPINATNFEDKIALLDIDMSQHVLRPGGQLQLTLNWQSLAPLTEDYTVFVQVLDTQDRIVGQVDSWPVQGTYPTSQWVTGERVSDPYMVQLDTDLPSGEYRLQVGWYLLATLRRLPVVNEVGAAKDDNFIASGLYVP